MNFTYTTNPGYWDLIRDTYYGIRWHYREENMIGYEFPRDFFGDFKKYYYLKVEESYPVIIGAILFTILRYIFEKGFCRPLIAWLKIDHKSDREKFPESFWKFLVYSVLWGYCADLLVFSGKYDYFTEPWNLWDDWTIGMEVPEDIRLLYFVECAFYLHSVYATLFMDQVRKDFLAMLIHHFLTLVLLIVSYAMRYHRTGLLVIFVHDVTDILLEFTKCNVHLKNRNGIYYKFHDIVANIGFATFTFAWFMFRLYWFPLKILYATSAVSVHRAYYRGAGLYAFFNSLLFILLCLDIYWFYFVLLFLYKVLTGQVKEVNDTRDYDEEKEREEKRKQQQKELKKDK